MRRVYIVLFIHFFLYSLFYLKAQNVAYDDFLNTDFHVQRREEFRKMMPENSVAIFFSAPIRNRSNDVDFIYHQDPNFYYLTGLLEPHSACLIFKKEINISGQKMNEVLFVRRSNALDELYNGKRISIEEAKNLTGIKKIFITVDFKNFPIDFSSFDKILFFDFENDVRQTDEEGDLYDLISWFKEKSGYPVSDKLEISEPTKSNWDMMQIKEILTKMRGIKTPQEIDLLRKAVFISAMGQVEAMKAIQPGISEAEVQGLHEFIFKKYRAEFEGYPSIVGAGHNGCVLHYIENYKPKLEDGELILMDLGAEYHGYTADVTRTVPVNGEFTKVQSQIYDLVLAAQEEAMKICKSGISFNELYLATLKTINSGLVDLGIYSSTKKEDIVNPATGRNRYYPHGCCHHIGLDVHDLGEYDVLESGMVITIEPGIYIPANSPVDSKWWGTAVRIEDDFLVTDSGCELLSKDAPRLRSEIEALMKEASVFNQLQLPEIKN